MRSIIKLHFQFTHRVEENLFLMSGSEIRGESSRNKHRELGLQIFLALAPARNQKSTEMWTKPPTRCIFHYHPLSMPLQIVWCKVRYLHFGISHPICKWSMVKM